MLVHVPQDITQRGPLTRRQEDPDERISPETSILGMQMDGALDFDHPGNGWTARPGTLRLSRARTCFDCGYVMYFTGVKVSESDAPKFATKKS